MITAMRVLAVFVAALALAPPASAAATVRHPGRAKAVQSGPTSVVRVAASAQRLTALGFDLAESGGRGGIDVVLHGNRDADLLRASGLRSRTLVADLDAPRARPRAVRAQADPLPSGRTTYRAYADYGAEMAALAQQRPDLVRPITIGQSVQGRAVQGLEITSDAGASDGKPVFLLMGEHHAREWPSAEVALEFALDLVHGYDSDARVHGLVDSVRTIVVPIVNPDGFILSRTGVNEWKRKNCNVPSGACDDAGNADAGVDPNRNYGGMWGGPGAATNPLAETYRGAGPFSEPETQNVRRLVTSRQVDMVVSTHTSGGLVLRPPDLSTAPDTPDEPALKALGDKMAADLGSGYVSKRAYELYDQSGITEDWTYYTAGALGFTIELVPSSGDFHPDYASGVVATYPGARAAYLDAMQTAADPAQHSQLTGSAPPGRVLRLTKQVTSTPRDGAFAPFPDTFDSTMVVPASGAFTWNVNPSGQVLWQLSCETADGTVLQTQSVAVARGQSLGVQPCSIVVPSGDGGASGAQPSNTTGAGLPAGSGSATSKAATPRLLALRVLTTSLRRARSLGVPVSASCPKRCTLTLSLRAGGRTVGRTVVKRLVGRHTIRVRLKTRHRRLTLVAKAVAADGRATTARRSLRLA